MKYWLKTIGVLSCKYGSQNMHDSTKVLCLEMIIEIMIRIGSLSLFENVEIRKDILPLFCLARIKYASWYVYDIYIIISYLHTLVSTIFQLRTKLCDTRDDFSFHIVNFPFIYIATFQQNLYTENISLIWYDKNELVDPIMIISLIEVSC